ncbi:hypothetical protein RRG08_021873 [Elysia crispata]|uniref:Uncharacterized protein n=1 Tax=Elysia crispata TaxID=231223 RepID=A0AAE0ZGP5_9GAST|nr:hypothetical protein RRG08_021873 [Elysia crispata]
MNARWSSSLISYKYLAESYMGRSSDPQPTVDDTPGHSSTDGSVGKRLTDYLKSSGSIFAQLEICSAIKTKNKIERVARQSLSAGCVNMLSKNTMSADKKVAIRAPHLIDKSRFLCHKNLIPDTLQMAMEATGIHDRLHNLVTYPREESQSNEEQRLAEMCGRKRMILRATHHSLEEMGFS